MDNHLAKENLINQNAKLAEEIKLLKRPFYRQPAAIGAIIAFSVSLVFNIGQYSNQGLQIRQKNEEIAQLKVESNARVQKLREEISALQLDNEMAERIKDLQPQYFIELDQIKSDVAVWDNGIQQSKMKLMLLQADLARYQSEGREIMAATALQNIELQQYVISQKESEMQKSIQRRSELEKLIFN